MAVVGVVLLVVEEGVHLSVPILSLSVAWGAAHGALARILVVGVLVVVGVRILLEEEVEMTLDVVLSGFLGKGASLGFVAQPVGCFGLDEVELFHREDGVVGSTVAAVSSHIQIGVVGNLVAGAHAYVVLQPTHLDDLCCGVAKRLRSSAWNHQQHAARVVGITLEA